MIEFYKIASLPEFQAAPPEKQNLVRDIYFKHYMAEKTPPDQLDRMQREFVYGEKTPVLSTLTPEREQSDKGLIRKGLEWGAEKLGIPFEPSSDVKSEEGARALVELQARDAGMKPGEFREGPQALNQAAASFSDAALLGIPGAIRKSVAGGDGLAPQATTTAEKIGSGVGELGGFIAGAPGAVMKPIVGLTAPIVKAAIPRATSLLERAASGVATQAPALATAFAARNVGEALQKPTAGAAASSMGRAAGEGFATGGIFGAAGAIQNRIARIATGMAALEAERATGLKAPIFDDRPIEEKAFDIAQTLFFLWGKGGNKVLDQAERSLKLPQGEPQRQLPGAYPRPEPFTMSHGDPPPGPTPQLGTNRPQMTSLPPLTPRLQLPEPAGYNGPRAGEGFTFRPAEPRAPVVEQKRRPAVESGDAFQDFLNVVQSPKGAALLKSRLAAEQAAAPIVDRVRLAAVERQRQIDEMAKEEQALAPQEAAPVAEASKAPPDPVAPAVAPVAKSTIEFKGTQDAIEYGAKATPEQVEELKRLRDERYAESKTLLKTDPQAAMDAATKGQFYREAVEASEGIHPTQIQAKQAEERAKPPVSGYYPELEKKAAKQVEAQSAHDYSNTQVRLPSVAAKDIVDFGSSIPENEIYTDPKDPSYGREKEPHITVRYGLATDNPAKLQKAFSGVGPIKAKFGKISIFKTDKYDVVKVDIESEALRNANKLVGEIEDVPGETHKDYKPHATIAYVKPGEGKKYVGNNSLSGKEVLLDKIYLSDRKGEQHEIALTSAPVPLLPPKAEAPKLPALTKPKAAPQATTLRGAIKALGGVNPLNFKGEFKEVPTAAKFLIKRSGTPIDLAEQRLKEDGWLGKDESLAMVLRDKENLRRGKVFGEGVAKREQDLTDQERQVKKEMDFESEAPPEGEYVPMKAGDLPLGKKLTLIDNKTARGWDEYTVKESDEFGVTLEGGQTINLPPDKGVEVLEKDLPRKALTPPAAKSDTRPSLVLQGERQMPKVQAEMRTKGKKMGQAEQGGIEFGAQETEKQKKVSSIQSNIDAIQRAVDNIKKAYDSSPPALRRSYDTELGNYYNELDKLTLRKENLINMPETIELKPEPVSAKETEGAKIVKERMSVPTNLAEAAAGKPQKTAEQVKVELDKARADKAGFDKIQNLQLEYDRLTNAPVEQGKTLEDMNKRVLSGARKESGWKTKKDKEGKQIEVLPGKGSVSGDETIGFYAFDQKGRVIGKGDVVDGFKTSAEARGVVEDNAKPKVDAKEDIGDMAGRMKDADPDLSAAKKAKKILMNESGAINIDFDALKNGIKGLRAKLPKKDIGLVTQGFGLPTWVADRYPNSAGKIQEVIDNRFRNKNMIRNEYYRELLDGWDGLTDVDKEKVGKALWKGDQLGKALSPAGLSKLSPPQRKAYKKTREILDYIWYEDRPELMRSMGLPNNEISEYYQQSGSRGGYMPHERKGRYFGRAIDSTLPAGDQVVYRKHFDDFLLTLTGQNVGVKQALVKSGIANDYPGKLIEIGENQKAMAEGAYHDVSPEATQELIDASMKYLNAPDSQKAALKTAMRQAVADVFKVRGFGEHFMKRKDVPGFDTSNWQDAVLNYVSSWAGYKSKLMAAREMWDVWGDVDWKGIPKLREYVSKQVKDTFSNETFADRAVDTARGILFRQYLSGVVKSAMLNLTQPFIATIPRLTTETRWAGTKVTAEMAKAAKDIVASIGTQAQGDMTKRQTAQAGRLTKEELMGVRRARENGIIGSQMTEELLGRAAGKFGSNLRKIDNFLGWAFANAELFNRETTYLTAFRIAKNEKKMSFEQAAKFAEDIVDQTQFRYGKTNLPPFARGEHWAAKGTRAAYAFRHYPNNLFHLWGKLAGSGPMGAAGISKSLLAMGAFGGAISLPFIQSIAWVYNQITGTDLLSDISEKAGEFSKYALYGVPGGALGVDLSGSLGTDIPTSLADVGGVVTDWAKRGKQTYEDLEAKDYQRAAEDFPFMPQAIRGPMAGVRMATRGMEKRSGKDVKDEDFQTVKLTPGDVAKKFAGFQPVKLSEVYRKEEAAKNFKSYWADKADSIGRQSRIAFKEGTGSQAWKDALKAASDFNAKRPQTIPPLDLSARIEQAPSGRETLLKRTIK